MGLDLVNEHGVTYTVDGKSASKREYDIVTGNTTDHPRPL